MVAGTRLRIPCESFRFSLIDSNRDLCRSSFDYPIFVSSERLEIVFFVEDLFSIFVRNSDYEDM
ncbi:hypothetical protein CP557_20740 [Natrinema ejinorense]|uniref:Uncharacterized protein n=1 Tax=Natrinema ejinorense TaxID=373386 RepID=A0A2A5QPX1_9EURY|nr:hypothetical protein CP557_20740 [Natrinema ejinorense]